MVLLTPLAFFCSIYGFAYQTPHLKTYRVLASVNAEAREGAVEYLRRYRYPTAVRYSRSR